MNAIIDTLEGIVFTCPHCAEELYLDDDDVKVLVHPARFGGWKGERFPINCPHAGKRFKRPTIKLEPA